MLPEKPEINSLSCKFSIGHLVEVETYHFSLDDTVSILYDNGKKIVEGRKQFLGGEQGEVTYIGETERYGCEYGGLSGEYRGGCSGSQTRTGRERWSGGVRAVLIPERVRIETNNLNQKGGEYGKLEI